MESSKKQEQPHQALEVGEEVSQRPGCLGHPLLHSSIPERLSGNTGRSVSQGVWENCVQIFFISSAYHWLPRALGNTTDSSPPAVLNSSCSYSLGPAIQPFFYPSKSAPIQAMNSQFLQEKAVGNGVKVLSEVERHQPQPSPHLLKRVTLSQKKITQLRQDLS